MALMFFHIPRTGGSTVWHTLANVAARQGKIVADLYHHSRQVADNPFFPNEALQHYNGFLEKNGLCFTSDVIYHHHTYQTVPYFLESDCIECVTLIRDPVSRVVSEAFHMRRFFREQYADLATKGALDAECDLYRKEYGETLFQLMIADDIDPDGLVLSYAKVMQNYYLSYFSRFLHSADQSTSYGEADTLNLVKQVSEVFVWVGQYPNLGDFISSCGLFADLDISLEQDLQHIANGSQVPSLKAETLAQVKEINALDYLFTDTLLQRYDQRLINRLVAQKKRQRDYVEREYRRLNDELTRQAELHQATEQISREELTRQTELHRAAEQASREELARQAALLQSAEQATRDAIAESAERAQALANCNASLQAVYSSRSWRMTKALRVVGSWVKR